MNEEKLNQLLGKMVGDLGAAVNGALVIIGDKLGLYKTLHQEGAMTSQQLADAIPGRFAGRGSRTAQDH